MAGRIEFWTQEICRRTEYKRKCRDRQVISGLSLCSIFLLASMMMLLERSKMPGVAAVPEGYGTVLLRDGASTYVVVGIAAFVLGVFVTAICIRIRKKKMDSNRDGED